MKLLDDHVVLITGAGSGLGLGVTRHCLEQGAQAAVFEVMPEKIASLKQEFGDKVLVCQGDVTKLADIRACRDAIVQRFGKLDAVISCHGIFDGNVPIAKIDAERVDSLFDEVFGVNVKGNFLLARVFHDLLDKTEGALVLTASSAAYAADGGGLAYTASKGAIRSTVNQLAFEFAPRVRVNAVAPAVIGHSQLRGPKSLGLEQQKQSDVPRALFEMGMKVTALIHRVPEPEDYGPLFAFLASRSNKVMTGQTILADQGALNRALISSVGKH